MLSMRVTFKIEGDRKLLEDSSKRLREPRDLMQRIGAFAVGDAQTRLNTVLKPESEVRSGDLQNSLTVFEVGEDFVEYGSNLPYAAQVQFGGTIEPRNARALAIPLLPTLQRQRLGPLDLDPAREILQFIPINGRKPNVIGLLINPDKALTGKQRKPRGTLSGYPPGPLFALATSVTQEARPYIVFDEDFERNVEEIYEEWMEGV